MKCEICYIKDLGFRITCYDFPSFGHSHAWHIDIEELLVLTQLLNRFLCAVRMKKKKDIYIANGSCLRDGVQTGIISYKSTCCYLIYSEIAIVLEALKLAQQERL